VNSFLRRFCGIIVACMTLLCVAKVASAQGLGAISGTVVDPTGGAVPSTSVVLTRVKTGETVTVQSHPDGLYVFPSISPVDYKLDITAPGCAPTTHERKSICTILLRQITSTSIEPRSKG
jgi:hypothetical protein